MPSKSGPFMLRVYGLWVHSGRVLLSQEHFAGRSMVKFPGGGLAFGEGLIDGLCREWREETGLTPQQPQHFYTTDFFQESAFHPGVQLISVYYLFREVLGPAQPFLESSEIQGREKEHFFWKAIAELNSQMLTFPIDQKVGLLLKEKMG